MPSSASRRTRSSLLGPEVFANLPPGSYHSDDEDQDEDDSGAQSDSSVVAYEEPPEYLRRNSNKDNPIRVDSSEDEGEGEEAPLFPASRSASPAKTNISSDDDKPGPSGPVLRKRTRDDSEGGSRTARRGQNKRDSKRRRSYTFVPQPPPAKDHSVPSGSSSSPAKAPVSPLPEPDVPVTSDPLAMVLDVLPDIDIGWAAACIEAEVAAGRQDNSSNRVLEMAFEIEGGYPKSKDKGKSKEKDTASIEEGAAEEYKSMQYRTDTRAGPTYYQKSIQQLEEDFPRVPLPFIRAALTGNRHMYVPAYYCLQDEVKKQAKSYTELKRPRTRGKGKSRGINSSQASGEGSTSIDDAGLAAFEAELAWLQAIKARELNDKDAEEARKLAHDEALANGGGIECGCCFGEEIWEEMFQCSDGHLFCRECVTKHAETKLGEESTRILCMDMSSCHSTFPESELSRLLSEKSLALYHRLKQADELERAGIEGLESCPNCPFAAVIDNPNEKLFRCMNEECGQVTCRACRRKDHIPKTCAEVEADLKLNNRHTVEDAMSEALIRRCPKCAKPYIKESGCNKIYCSKCHTMSCYVCQKQIQGYDHFDQNPANYRAGKAPGKCALWDSAEAQNDANAIREARDNAQHRVRAAAQANGVDLDENDLDVDLPGAPAGPPGLPGVPQYMAQPAALLGQPPYGAPYGMPRQAIGMAIPQPGNLLARGLLVPGRPYPPPPAVPDPPPVYPGNRYPQNDAFPGRRHIRRLARQALGPDHVAAPIEPFVPGPLPAIHPWVADAAERLRLGR